MSWSYAVHCQGVGLSTVRTKYPKAECLLPIRTWRREPELSVPIPLTQLTFNIMTVIRSSLLFFAVSTTLFTNAMLTLPRDVSTLTKRQAPQGVLIGCYSGGAGGCPCPIDNFGDEGLLINVFPGYQCAYPEGACSWSDKVSSEMFHLTSYISVDSHSSLPPIERRVAKCLPGQLSSISSVPPQWVYLPFGFEQRRRRPDQLFHRISMCLSEWCLYLR